MKTNTITLTGPILIIILWFIINKLKIVDYVYLPRVEDTLLSLKIFFEEDGILHLILTFSRTLVSFLLASTLGIPLGLIIGYSTNIYKASELVIDFFRSVPSTAFFPLFLLLFGVEDLSKIMLSAFVTFWIILINTIHGVWNSSKIRVQVAKVFKCSNLQIFKDVLFFDSLPQIFVGLRSALSVSLVIVVVAEMFVGTKFGMGRKIYDSYTSYKTANLFSDIILTGLLGYTVNKTFLSLQKRVVHWTDL